MTDRLSWIFIGQMSESHWYREKVSSNKVYGIGHVLSKIQFCETPKKSLQQSFKVGYTINLDTPFKFNRTQFHRVARV